MTRKRKKYNWPTKEQLLQYKADNLSAVEVGELHGIPPQQIRTKLWRLGIVLRNHATPRVIPDAAPAPEADAVDDRPQETPAEFVARGGEIKVLKSQQVPHQGRGKAFEDMGGLGL